MSKFFFNYVAVQQNVNTNYFVIIGFSDSVNTLIDLIKNRYSYGKKQYQFFIYATSTDSAQYHINAALLNICKSAALAMEIALLKKKNKNKRYIRLNSLPIINRDFNHFMHHIIDLPFPFDLPAIAVIS